MTDNRPRIAITMGDAAGVGPEIIMKAWPTLRCMSAAGRWWRAMRRGWNRRARWPAAGSRCAAWHATASTRRIMSREWWIVWI